MRIAGIDPGTGSFDFFGMDGDRVILDMTVPVPEVAKDPLVLLEVVRKVFPLDMIVGPSGYGLPPTSIKDMAERELDLMVPDDKSVPLYDGIRMVLRLMKAQGFPVWFTPGVIHLSTVPPYRKVNRMDMGTADKVCCTALAIRDQAERYSIDYSETSFIMAEIGFAFTAIIGVGEGRIVDGIGGTSGGPGFITPGSMDAELAVRLGKFPGVVLFTGGARDVSGREDLTPEEMASYPDRYAPSWNLMLESIEKSVAAMTVAVRQPREVILSGRLSRVPQIAAALTSRLSRFAAVRRVERRAKVAKEAAEGAYILGEGLCGGRYRGIVEALKLREACGTMYDHVALRGVHLARP